MGNKVYPQALVWEALVLYLSLALALTLVFSRSLPLAEEPLIKTGCSVFYLSWAGPKGTAKGKRKALQLEPRRWV